MNCCLFKKGSKASTKVSPYPAPPASSRPDSLSVLPCGRCRSPQAISSDAIVMVCASCNCVNRILQSDRDSVERKTSYIDCDIGDSQLVQINSSLFQLGDRSDNKSIPVCSVCLDGPGDMILDNCGHGGICEDCTRHIALNKAVGGAHCPLDKVQITRVLRIGEMHAEIVKAREIPLPVREAREPPKVPPPIGLRKSKNEPSDS
jgi:hypothetical protein